MNKILLIVGLLALGGAMVAGAAPVQNLNLAAPLSSEVKLNFNINTRLDEMYLLYWDPNTVDTIGGLGVLDTYKLATWFNPLDFTDPLGYKVGYPLWIKELQAYFYEFDGSPWTNDKFKFSLYTGNTGLTKVYESGEIAAVKTPPNNPIEPTIFDLPDSVRINSGRFWVAADPVDSGGSPMMCYDYGNLHGHSFIGTPGKWQSFATALPPDYHAGELLTVVLVNYTPLAVAETPAPKTMFGLVAAPTHAGVEIRYSLTKSGFVSLAIFDVTGRSVETLVSQKQETGSHIVTWNQSDRSGNRVPAGAYLCRLSVGGASEVKKVVLAK